MGHGRDQSFELRVARWWPELHAGLTQVYPLAAVPELERGLAAIAERAYAERDPALQRLDEQRLLAPDWFQAPGMLGYAAYTDRFAGDLSGVVERIGYLRELGVTYLHLMPFLRSRPGDDDGGYAVSDYRAVRPELGTIADLRALAATLHDNGISLVCDLVLNHVAREHEWAVAARAGDPRYRAYFAIFPDRQGPDAFEQTLPEVFPDFAPGNFTWDAELNGWVWTTFNAFQWDLDWSNPQVFLEFAEIVCFLVNTGVDVLRLDAIAFVWKRLGTNCQNQPEVHAITQALRALLRIVAPGALLKAEAIVAPSDLVHYLGRGRHHGKVSDLAYHNTLMVQVWSMLATRDVRLAVQALRALPRIPSNTAWLTYLRCHDDIGWAIEDADAAVVGLDGFAHRAFLSDFYTGEYPGSFADGLTFQRNEQTGDRRVSGMAAELVGLTRAEGAGDPEARRRAVDRLRLAYSIVLGWGGLPVLWMGDELGQPGDPDWARRPGHETDNRWAHRPAFDPMRAGHRHQADTVAGEVFAAIGRLTATRRRLPHLHAGVPVEVLDAEDPGVLAVVHRHPEGDLLQLYNVTETWRWFSWARLSGFDVRGHDALTDAELSPTSDGLLWLPPYAGLWVL